MTVTNGYDKRFSLTYGIKTTEAHDLRDIQRTSANNTHKFNNLYKSYHDDNDHTS